jgi:hypothetical protein
MTIYNLSTNSPEVTQGHVVCVDPETGLPTKATPESLGRARAVLGVVVTEGKPGEAISVAETGLVRKEVTLLNGGPSATVIVDAQARCARAPLPWGGEYVVGICDTAGNLTVQPRSEIGTGSPHYLNVRAYGARGDGVHYDDESFAAAFAAMKAMQITAGPTQGPTVGMTLFVPPGTYRLGKPLVVARTCIIVGAGGHMEAPATILLFDAGQQNYDTAGRLHIHPADAAAQAADGVVLATDTPNNVRAYATQIRNLLIQGRDKVAPSRGLVARARFHLENVTVYGFPGNGIDVYGNIASTQHSDASCWYVANCSVASCGGHGLFLDGPDVNAGVAVMLDCRDNGGIGIYDSSFLGNTFVACHTNNNHGGSYKTDNPNQRSIFVGCYAEGGQPPAQVMSHSILIGGLQGASGNEAGGTGLRIQHETNAASGSITQFEVPVATGAGTAGLVVGGDVPHETGGDYFAFGGTDKVYNNYFRLALPVSGVPRAGEWLGFYMGYGNPTLLLPMFQSRINVGPGVEKKAGLTPAFPQGFRWGRQYNLFGQLARQDGGAPGNNEGTFEPGDILFNRYVMDGSTPWFGWIGAVCTKAGTAGTYAEGRTATADGTDLLTLDAPSTVLQPGDCIMIGNRTTRIAAVNGAAVKVNSTIPLGGALPIAYVNPVFTRFGKLEMDAQGQLIPAPK